MKKLKFIPCLLALVFCTMSAGAQDQDDDKPRQDEPKDFVPEEIPEFMPSFKGAFKLPNTMANNSFKKVFNGLGNVELGYIHPFLKNFFAGGGVQYSYYDINKFSFPEVTHGNFQSYLGYAEIGFQKYMTERWYYMVSVRAGYSNVKVECENCDVLGLTPGQGAAYGEGTAGVYVHGNERMSYGLMISYQLYNFQFNPSWICRPSISGLTDKDYEGISQALTIGFGFACIIGKLP